MSVFIGKMWTEQLHLYGYHVFSVLYLILYCINKLVGKMLESADSDLQAKLDPSPKRGKQGALHGEYF